MASSHEGWRRARLETILDLSLALGALRREGEVIEELVQRAVGLLDAGAGIALSLRPPLEIASVVAVGWPAGEEAAARLSTEPALEPVRAGEVHRLPGAALGLELGEVLVAPCLWHEELIGLVAVADKETRGGGGRFDEDDARFLRSLALLAASAVASCRELETVQRRSLALEEENRALRAGGAEEGGIVGQSAPLRRVLELVRRVAPTDVTVLVRGESGTGKERIARLLHALSQREKGPFVPLNCAAVPETLLEAELFGIERGVATGVEARIGKFELADGGTLFLDEVGDLSPLLQSKLLRVVQEREVERVGGRHRVRVDVRLVTATNRDLEAMISAGEFRSDLYYRLRVVELRLPRLRDRRDDIPLLAQHFLKMHGRRHGREGAMLSRDALELLLHHDFPGNVRELENLLEAAVALSTSDRIGADDLRLAMGGPAPEQPGGRLDDVIRAHVERTLERFGGNRAAAARELGIDRSTLYRMLARRNATEVAIRNSAPSASVEKSDRPGGRR